MTHETQRISIVPWSRSRDDGQAAAEMRRRRQRTFFMARTKSRDDLLFRSAEGWHAGVERPRDDIVGVRKWSLRRAIARTARSGRQVAVNDADERTTSDRERRVRNNVIGVSIIIVIDVHRARGTGEHVFWRAALSETFQLTAIIRLSTAIQCYVIAVVVFTLSCHYLTSRPVLCATVIEFRRAYREAPRHMRLCIPIYVYIRVHSTYTLITVQ